MTEGDDRVARLPHEPVPEQRPTPPTRLHGLAIGGMAACALLGILSMLAFITINWPETAGRYVVGAFVVSGVGFLACASAAVLTAARDTYARQPSRGEE